MKKILVYCILILTLGSCSITDDKPTPAYNLEFVPIESVEIPQTFDFGQVYTIFYTYNRPTNCYDFHDLYYERHNNEFTITLANKVYTQTQCDTLVNNQEERSFNFNALSNGTYIFKFWSGLNENEEDIYLTHEVEVID